MRQLLLAGSTNPWLRDKATKTAFVRRSVSRFMPGEQIEDALRAAAELKPQGITTMQAINRAAPAPVFMGLFLGTAAACLAVAVWSLFLWGNGSTAWLLAGGLVYLAGSFGLTVGYHVPRNNALASADPDGAEAARQWATYLREWTRWNHVRGCASLAAAILFTMALVLG